MLFFSKTVKLANPKLMTKNRFFLCLLLLLGCVRGLLAEDSSEQFLNAYQAYQQGEKLERDGSSPDALKKYKFAQSLLLEIEKNDPSWQKAVVEYRLKKTRDGIERLQGNGNSNDGIITQSPIPPSDGAPTASPASANIRHPSSTPTPRYEVPDVLLALS